MRFLVKKRRQAPTIIIISLIDILIVLLIFMMVTTTFKQQPSLKLALPESKQSKPGVTETTLIITVAKQEPFLYLGNLPITSDRLQAELASRAQRNPQIMMSIRADKEAPFGQIIKVMDAAKAANIKSVSAVTMNTK